MKELVFVNNNNEVVTDSLMVAEQFNKRHDDVLRAVDSLIDTLKGAGISLGSFAESEYENGRGRKYRKFIMNREGFSNLVMSFKGKEATIFRYNFIKEFDRMEEHIKSQEKPKQALDYIQLLAQGTMELKERLDVVEDNVNKRMTIDYQQQRMIQNLVEGRVRHLWNNGTPVGRFTKRQLFMKAYRRLKDRYGTSSYKDILVKDFEDATTYIQGWKGE